MSSSRDRLRISAATRSAEDLGDDPVRITREEWREDPDHWVREAEDGPIIVTADGVDRFLLSAPLAGYAPDRAALVLADAVVAYRDLLRRPDSSRQERSVAWSEHEAAHRAATKPTEET